MSIPVSRLFSSVVFNIIDQLDFEPGIIFGNEKTGEIVGKQQLLNVDIKPGSNLIFQLCDIIQIAIIGIDEKIEIFAGGSDKSGQELCPRLNKTEDQVYSAR